MGRVPGYLYAPSTSAVTPPIDTAAQLLPFGELHWEDFERLCLRLAWRLLADNFRNEPALVAAIDRWLLSQEHNDSEISFAALVGRTQRAKEKLISLVATSSMPFSAADALLEGWTMEDSDVADALLAGARGPVRQAGYIADYLPRILKDRDELAERLLVLLAAPENDRPAFSLRAIAQLKDAALAERAAEIALERDRPGTEMVVGELSVALIEHFSCDPRVRPLALAACSSDIASLPRLLAGAGALTPETRAECEALLDRALEGDLVHLIGLDLVEGRRRAVAFALADAIGATPI